MTLGDRFGKLVRGDRTDHDQIDAGVAELGELALLLCRIVFGDLENKPQVALFGGGGFQVGLKLRPPWLVDPRQANADHIGFGFAGVVGPADLLQPISDSNTDAIHKEGTGCTAHFDGFNQCRKTLRVR